MSTMIQSSDDIQLNLSVQQTSDFFVKKKKEIKASKRKFLEKREEEETCEGEDGVTRKGKRKYEESHEEEREGKKSKVSSLFGGNPEVPYLSMGDVQPVKEEVFSSACFHDLPLQEFMISNLEKNLGLRQLTSVQQQAVPVILTGRDALIKSQTGSGKTLAYAVPIIQSLQELQPRISRTDGIYVLVVVPTRELAIQSYEWFQKLVRSCTWVVPGYLLGGEKKKSEKARLRKGVNILIATPGRLIDHIETTGRLSLQKVQWLVLDEADRLLDMGYERDVSRIITSLNEQGNKRQTVMLSATLTPKVERLAGISMQQPVTVDVAATAEEGEDFGTNLATPENLKQHFMLVPVKLRLVTLCAFIQWKCEFLHRKMLIFMSTQDMVDYHTALFKRIFDHSDSQWLREYKMTADAEAVLNADTQEKVPVEFLKLHGTMSQKDRTAVFQAFREASTGVLLCTDVAARGLDLPRVHWIVQYNAPASAADYVHRVGRTARIGGKGSALLLLTPSEVGFLKFLEDKQISIKQQPMEKILQMLITSGGEEASRNPEFQSIEEAATRLQHRCETAVLRDRTLNQLARKAYMSFVRAYATYPKELREVFHFKGLHLGHCAKSFALREAPTYIGGLGKKERRSQLKRTQHTRPENHLKLRLKQQKQLLVSEFASGFETPGARRKTIPGTARKGRPRPASARAADQLTRRDS